MKPTSTKHASCPPFKSCEKAELKHTKQYLFGETTEYPMRASAEREKRLQQRTDSYVRSSRVCETAERKE